MIICHEQKLAFLHIQKTGGKSIRKVLQETFPTAYVGKKKAARLWHIPAKQAYTRWNCLHDYYCFAFVRNPWDRLVSWYHFMRQTESKRRRRAKELDFPEWLQTYGIGNLPTQADMLCKNGKVMVDFVGRFESLQEDFDKIGDKFEFNAALPHINVSSHKDYHDYYTMPLQRLVAKRYERDCELFGYAFDD